MGGGPFIYIPLPRTGGYAAHVPVNATGLLWEWAAMLDPAEAAKDRMAETLGAAEVWDYGRWFVEPSGGTLFVIREMLKDHEVHERLEATEAVLGVTTRL